MSLLQNVYLKVRRLIYVLDLWADFGGEKDHKKLAIGTWVYFWNLGDVKTGKIAGYDVGKQYIIHFTDKEGEWEIRFPRRNCIKCRICSTCESWT